MTRAERRTKRMLLSSVGLTAGTLLFSCGPGDDSRRPLDSGVASGGTDGGGGSWPIHGNPKGCWYDDAGYGDCERVGPPRGGAGGTPSMNGEAGCAAGAGPGGYAGFEGDVADED